MSGITTGTRLERLEQLAARIAMEIRMERRLNPPPRLPAKPYESTSLLAELGVTSKHVKEWACTQGLIPVVARGRVALAVVEAYAAHMDTREQLDHGLHYDDHAADCGLRVNHRGDCDPETPDPTGEPA